MAADKIFFATFDSPLGELVVGVSSRGCSLVEFVERGGLERIKAWTQRRYGLEMVERESALLDTVEEALKSYFTGSVRLFSFPLDLQGTAFEKSVWQQLLAIPYGQTKTYSDLARLVDKPKAFRAVGRANGSNPLAIVVPCHRVVQTGGGMGGYGGGIWRKEFLLDLEKQVMLSSDAQRHHLTVE